MVIADIPAKTPALVPVESAGGMENESRVVEYCTHTIYTERGCI